MRPFTLYFRCACGRNEEFSGPDYYGLKTEARRKGWGYHLNNQGQFEDLCADCRMAWRMKRSSDLLHGRAGSAQNRETRR